MEASTRRSGRRARGCSRLEALRPSRARPTPGAAGGRRDSVSEAGAGRCSAGPPPPPLPLPRRLGARALVAEGSLQVPVPDAVGGGGRVGRGGVRT